MTQQQNSSVFDRLCLSAFLVVLACGWSGSAAAQDFRIETEIFVGKKKEPAVETLTIFQGEYVYDFLLPAKGVGEITLFDLKRKRLVLLDPNRKIQTTLPLEQLLEISAWMKQQLVKKQPKAGVSPELEADTESDDLIVRDYWFEYRVAGQEPKAENAAVRYHVFADWYARLNATRPGNPPPYARLALNKALAAKGKIPKTVVRKLRHHPQLEPVHSRHYPVWRLSNKDRERIKEAGDKLSKYPSVELQKYWESDRKDTAN